MKTNFLLLIFLFSFSSLFAQPKTLIVYDFKTKTTDSIVDISFDPSVTSDQTDFFIGDFSSEIEDLPTDLPTDNLFSGSQFTFWQKASDEFDLSKFPIRTSMKLYSFKNDSLVNNCSATMVSRRHVLTAAHCFINPSVTRAFTVDSSFACPVFDFGNFNLDFECSEVQKIFYFKNWIVTGEDMMLLELEKPIGNETGWLGLGFNDEDDFFEEKPFHKFSYPGEWIRSNDPPIDFNGDTIYYKYGAIDLIDSRSLASVGAEAAFGESGSAIISVENRVDYTIFGTLTWAGNSKHSRINNWRFASFREVIKNDLVDVSIENDEPHFLKIYPNPASDLLTIKYSNSYKVQEAYLTDIQGRKVKVLTNFENENEVDISNLPEGMYFLVLKNETQITNHKLTITRL